MGYCVDHLTRPGWRGSSHSATSARKNFTPEWTWKPENKLAFRGQFEYTLDAKKRLNVPAKFRPAFADGVVLAKALEPCVAIWSPAAFEQWTESFLGNLNPVSKERRSLARYFSGNSWDVELDSAGRVTLSQPLMEYAGIEKEVVVVGNLDHIEVWDRGRWQKDQETLDSEIVEIAESLGHPS